MATLLEQVKEAIEKFKTDDSVIKAKGASDNLVAYLVPDTYEVSDLRGKVLVYCPRAQAGNKYRIALQSTGPKKALGDKTLEVSCVILKDDMTLGNLESSGRTKVIISGSGDKKNKDFKDSVDAIADALKIEKPKKIVKDKGPIKFVDGATDDIYGYFDVGPVATAVVGNSKRRPVHEIKKTIASSKSSKIDKRNNKLMDKISDTRETLDIKVVSDKKRLELENKIARLFDEKTENRPIKIIATKNTGVTGKIDFFVYLGAGDPPKTLEALRKDSETYKVRKAGFQVIKGKYTPVIEVYGKPYEVENASGDKEIRYGQNRRIVDTSGANKALVALVEAFNAVRAARIDDKTAYQTAFESSSASLKYRNLLRALDNQRNEYFEAQLETANIKEERKNLKTNKKKDMSVAKETRSDAKKTFKSVQKKFEEEESKFEKLKKAFKRKKSPSDDEKQKFAVLEQKYNEEKSKFEKAKGEYVSAKAGIKSVKETYKTDIASISDRRKKLKPMLKRSEASSSGEKGGGVKTRTVGEGIVTALLGTAIGLGIGAGLTFAAQIPGYSVNAVNADYARELANDGAHVHIEEQLETATPETGDGTQTANYNPATGEWEGTLFNYTNENGTEIKLDTNGSVVEKMFEGENASTFGYNPQDDGIMENVEGEWWRNIGRAAFTNMAGFNYSNDIIGGSYEALGSMAGQEIKENGVELAEGVVVYPNNSTDSSTFKSFLMAKGMTADEAETATTSYANEFVTAYEISENQFTTDNSQVEIEPDFEINDNLQQTVNAVVGKDIQIVNINYDNDDKEGSIYGLDADGNLVKISFTNGADYNIEVTNNDGFESALLEADANDTVEISTYKSIDGLGLSETRLNNIHKYMAETEGAGEIYYAVTPQSSTSTEEAHYDVDIVTLNENDFDVVEYVVNVYSSDGKTTTYSALTTTAISAILDGKIPGGAMNLYTLASENPERYPYKNQLSEESISQIKENMTPNAEITTPVLTSTEDKEKV